MPLEVTVDDRAVRAALQKLPGQAARGVKKGMSIFGTGAVRDFTREHLSAIDDRVAVPELGGLGIRPAGSRGLVRRSGEFARSFLTTTAGTTIDSLKTLIGFLSPLVARKARIHELGTIGKGGTLPDIVGRPFLAVPIRGLGAALGKAAGFILLRKVSIPPRLGFRAFFKRRLRSGQLEKDIKAGVDRVLKGRAA